MDTLTFALPWVAMALIFLVAVLAGEVPEPLVRRAMIGAGVFLFLGTALGVWLTPMFAPVPHLLVASGPLAFLLPTMLLRRAVLSSKGGEPVLLLTALDWQGRSRRVFFQPGAPRRVTGWDTPYTLLLGMGSLLAALPAMAMIAARSAAG